MELRSRGLYVIAPGARHPSGVLYAGNVPPARRLPEPPTSVLELHAHGAELYGTGDLVVPDDGVEIEQGGRHVALLGWAMSRLYGRGVLGEPALAAMLAENQRRVRPPLEPSEVQRLWRWADKRIAHAERRFAAAPPPPGSVASLWAGHGLRRRR